MGTDFNGDQINTCVPEVDSLPLLLIPSLYYTIAGKQKHRLMALMWMAAYKTYSQTKVLYPAALWAGVEEYASSLVYFVQPPPAALLYTNHHFLTPCYHFLVRALFPHHLSIPLFRSPRLIIHQQPAGVSGWHLSAGNSGCQPSRLQQQFFIFTFLCRFSLRFTATPLQLISFEGLTAVRRSGCTNGRLIRFSGLLPEAIFWPLVWSRSPTWSSVSLLVLMGH